MQIDIKSILCQNLTSIKVFIGIKQSNFFGCFLVLIHMYTCVMYSQLYQLVQVSMKKHSIICTIFYLMVWVSLAQQDRIFKIIEFLRQNGNIGLEQQLQEYQNFRKNLWILSFSKENILKQFILKQTHKTYELLQFQIYQLSSRSSYDLQKKENNLFEITQTGHEANQYDSNSQPSLFNTLLLPTKIFQIPLINDVDESKQYDQSQSDLQDLELYESDTQDFELITQSMFSDYEDNSDQETVTNNIVQRPKLTSQKNQEEIKKVGNQKFLPEQK